MKKIIFTAFFVALIFPRFAFSQTITLPMPTVTIAQSPKPSPIDYQLPYPGILPGSPLYGLKLIRDRVSDLLTSSPLKKSNFYLLQADKRLSASLVLYEKGETKLAEETLSRGINYLEKSFSKMEETKKTSENVSDVYLKIKSSLAKHLEEIEKLQKTAKGEEAGKLKEDYQRVLEIQNKVNSFKP